MRLLLDTHAFLWFVWGDARLSGHARALIADPLNDCLFSPASFWEIAIKISTGKLTLAEPLDVFMLREIYQNQIGILPITVPHAAVVETLPFHHRDPFDRMLIAQAIVEQVPLVSTDSALDAYPITRLW